MSLIIIVALLTLVLLICVFAGNVFAEEAGVKTAGTSDQVASLGTPFPQPKADLAYEAGGTLKGDMPAAKTHHDLGIVYLEKGQYDLALAEFNKALEIYSMSAEIYNNRGITYSKMGRYDLAISDFTTAIKINPAGDKPYYNRGTTYALNGQYAQSLLDFDRTLEHNPFNDAAYNDRGSVPLYFACSDWGKACRIGTCDRLKEATRIGVCIKANKNSNLKGEPNDTR